ASVTLTLGRVDSGETGRRRARAVGALVGAGQALGARPKARQRPMAGPASGDERLDRRLVEAAMATRRDVRLNESVVRPATEGVGVDADQPAGGAKGEPAGGGSGGNAVSQPGPREREPTGRVSVGGCALSDPSTWSLETVPILGESGYR